MSDYSAVLLVDKMAGYFRGAVVQLGICFLEGVTVTVQGVIFLRIDEVAVEKEFPELVYVDFGTDAFVAVFRTMQ